MRPFGFASLRQPDDFVAGASRLCIKNKNFPKIIESTCSNFQNLRLLLDMSLQSITLSCIAPLARPRKPMGGEIALDARSEPSAASFGLRLWKRRQMGLIRWEGRACRDRQKRTRQACPSRLQSNPFIAEAITSRREASSDSPCRAQAAPPDTKRLRRHESSNTSFI